MCVINSSASAKHNPWEGFTMLSLRKAHSNAPELNLKTPELLTVPEVATQLGITSRRVQMLLRDGYLPGVRTGYRWRVPRSALREYIQQLVRRSHRNLRSIH